MLSLSSSKQEVITSLSPITLTLFIALSLALFLLKWLSSLNFKKHNFPPSPPSLPIIGNLYQLGSYPRRSLRALAQIHGPIMLLRLGRVPTLVISSANMAREIMKTHDIIFSDRPASRINKIVVYDQRDIAAAPYGEYWRQLKSISVLHLLSNRRVLSYRNVREEETSLMIEEIRKYSPLPVNLSEVFAKLTNDIVCRVALGRKYGASAAGEGRSFKDILREIGDVTGLVDFGEFIPCLAWVNSANGMYSKAAKLAKEMDDFLERVVDEHVKNGEQDRKDFVDVLLRIQKENMAGFPLDKTSIKAIIFDVFFAGTDTTYTALEWVMTELLRHPKAMAKLQTEIREAAENKSEITEDDISKMPYLKAVIKETLRLHPPVPLLLPRAATQDVKVKGFDIAAGTLVIINTYAIGRDPALWDRAEEFFPERFLNSDIDFKGQNFELIPFGSGRRMCPGIQFAMSSDELALAKLLHKFDWKLHGVESPQDLDMNETIGATAHRKFPLLAVATPYSPPN